MVRAEYIVRTVIAAAVLAVTWWNAVARAHNAHVESPTLGFRDYILLGLVFGAAACFALKILLPLRRCRRLSPITWVFVFTVSGWLAGSQIQTKAELVFDSWPPRPYAHHHFPRGWPFAMVDTVIVHEQRPDGLLERGGLNINTVSLAANIAVWVVLVGCGGYVCEQSIRKRFTISLLSVFTIMTATAVLLSLHHVAPSLIYPVEPELYRAVHPGESEWYMRLPAALCVATAIGTAIHVVWVFGGSIARRSQRRGPCQD